MDFYKYTNTYRHIINSKHNGVNNAIALQYSQVIIRNLMYEFLIPLRLSAYSTNKKYRKQVIRLAGILSPLGFENTIVAINRFVRNQGAVNLADIFSCYYFELDNRSELSQKGKCKIKPPLPEYRSKITRGAYRAVGDLKNYEQSLKKYVHGFYLHGSFGNHDEIVDWSDLDTLLVVKQASIDNLMEFRRLYRRITEDHFIVDPQQLHGPFIVTETDLRYYPESFFPLTLFKHAKSLFANDVKLTFCLRNDDIERKAVLWHQSIRYFRDLARNSDSLRLVKNYKLFLHRIFSIPIFFFQATGAHVFKKESFSRFTDIFPVATMIFEQATEVMYRWPDEHTGKGKTVVAAFIKDGVTRKFYDRRSQVIREIVNLETKLWRYVIRNK